MEKLTDKYLRSFMCQENIDFADAQGYLWDVHYEILTELLEARDLIRAIAGEINNPWTPECKDHVEKWHGGER